MEIDERYLAGLFDGEGCLSLCRASKSTLLRKRDTRFSLQCSITNTQLPVLKFIKIWFGGNLYSEKNGDNPKWRNKHVLMWTGKKAKQFLETVRPFVIIKRDQLDFMFDTWFPFYELSTQKKGRLRGLPDGEVERRETLALQLRALKHIEYAIPEKQNNK